MNVVLTSMICGVDPQRRGRRFRGRLLADTPWTVVLDGESEISPYLARWIMQRDWLLARPEVEWVWCVDATDVTLIREPWHEMEHGVLYVGSEPVITGCQWLQTNHPASRYLECFDAFAFEPLLNCGLVGGDRETVLAFLNDMVGEIERMVVSDPGIVLDMGPFNFVVRTRWNDRFFTGPKVHTVFKANRDNGCAWWKHK